MSVGSTHVGFMNIMNDIIGRLKKKYDVKLISSADPKCVFTLQHTWTNAQSSNNVYTAKFDLHFVRHTWYAHGPEVFLQTPIFHPNFLTDSKIPLPLDKIWDRSTRVEDLIDTNVARLLVFPDYQHFVVNEEAARLLGRYPSMFEMLTEDRMRKAREISSEREESGRKRKAREMVSERDELETLKAEFAGKEESYKTKIATLSRRIISKYHPDSMEYFEACDELYGVMDGSR